MVRGTLSRVPQGSAGFRRILAREILPRGTLSRVPRVPQGSAGFPQVQIRSFSDSQILTCLISLACLHVTDFLLIGVAPVELILQSVSPQRGGGGPLGPIHKLVSIIFHWKLMKMK